MNDGGKREFFSRYFCVQGYSVRRYLRSEALRVKNRWSARIPLSPEDTDLSRRDDQLGALLNLLRLPDMCARFIMVMSRKHA